MPGAQTRTSYHHGALRDELIRACVALIEAEGIGAVSLRRVAREAGVSPGAPYHHFADRSALLTMQEVLSSLPPNMPFRMERMRFTGSDLELDGRVRAYGDIDALTSAARRAGLEAAPPEAHRDGEGFWSFGLRGTRSPRSPSC